MRTIIITDRYWRCIKMLLPIVSLLLSFCSFCTGQSSTYQEFNVKTMLPTSPEAAALGKFGDIPIGYYTGTANVTIPLQSIRVAGIEIPITLSYHGGGFKTDEQATNVGLGWSLDPGGAIIQIVNGTEDKNDHLVSADTAGWALLKSRMITGAFTQTNETGTALWQCSPSYGTCSIGSGGSGDHYTTLSDIVSGMGQPDIYQYSFPGASGKFYINPETQKVVLIDQKEKIDFVRINDSSWSATTLNGNKFYFSAMETSSSYLVSTHTGYTWKLTSIVLPNGKTITYVYTDGHYEWYTYDEQYHDDYDMNLNPTGQHGLVPYWDVSQHNTKNLSEIRTSGTRVVFNLEGRTDLDILKRDSSKRIGSIDVYDSLNSRKVRSFVFSYSYFPYDSATGGYFGKSLTTLDTAAIAIMGRRLRLDSVQEVGYDRFGATSKLPPYRFYYDSSAVLPLKTSYAQDFWGYFNGQNNSNLLPDLSYFHYSMDSSYSNLPSTFLNNVYFTGANRIPDTSKMHAGLLVRMVYPTGGYTDYSYESNSFSNYNYPDQNKAALAFKTARAQDKNLTTDTTSTPHLTFHGNTIIRFTNTISKGVPIQGLGFQDLKNSYIELVRIVGSTPTILKVWQMANSDSVAFNANGGQFVWNEDVSVTYNSSAYYVISVSLPDVLGAQNNFNKTAFVTSVASYYDTVGVNLKMSYGAGVRIKTITNYSAPGLLVNKKLIRYNNPDSTSSGLLMSPLQYYYPRRLWFSKNAPGSTNCTQNLYSTDTTWYMSADGAIPFSDGAAGNKIGYSRVDEVLITAGGTGNGVHTFYYNNHSSKFKVNNPDDPDLTNGLMAKEEIQSNSLDTLTQMNYYYTDIDTGVVSFTGVKMFNNWIGLDQCGPPTSLTPFPLYKYEIDFYPITSRWMVPLQKVTKIYAGTSTSTDSINYYYNNIGQNIKTIQYDSKGQKHSHFSLYPNDTTSSQATLLKDSSLNDMALQEKTAVDDKETERTDNVYAVQNGYLVKTQVNRSFRNGASFLDANFDQYGINKTLTQFTQRGQTNSLIWDGRNNYVIAQCANAPQTAVAYTSFETEGTGNWSVGSSSRDTTMAITGRQSYNLSNGNITKGSLSSGKMYVVSYWSTNGTKSISGGSGSSRTGRVVGGWTYYEHTITASSSTITISGSGPIDELRLYPLGAQMNTYTFMPLVGMTSMADASGEITYYEYDAFSRLKNIKDYQGNIIKNYVYNYAGSCGDNCSTLTMQTLNGSNTLSYPVGVFNVNGKLLGNATSQSGYISLWMGDTANSHIGTLSAGADSMHFHLALNSGKTPPAAVTGLRYYQFDISYTNIDALRNTNGAYIDFGDGTGMRMNNSVNDSSGLVPPANTVVHYFTGSTQPYVVHTYPDTTQKTITCYHNDSYAFETFYLDNYANPATSLTKVKNLRGYLPQYMTHFGSSCLQQPTMLTMDNIINWNSITTIDTVVAWIGDGANEWRHLNFSQDFMQHNKGLKAIRLSGDYYSIVVRDTSFKLHIMKSDWNTYFTNLQVLRVCDDNWNREDISGLLNLNSVTIIATNQNHSNDPTSNPIVPLPASVVDNVINQISAGAGQYVSNGLISIKAGGTARTSSSDAAVTQLNGKGWTIYVNDVLVPNP